MVPTPACPRLLLLVLALAFLHPAEGVCSTGKIHCRTTSGCIYKQNVCDGSKHCQDGSDEDNAICKFWPARTNKCSGSNMEYQGSCYSVDDMCKVSSRAQTLDPRICKIMQQPSLEPLDNEMPMDIEVVARLRSAVNSTLNAMKPDCPMLYMRVGNDCLAFFSPAKISWPEARQFCHSIYGDLWEFTSIEAYVALLEFLREEEFTSNYWIGGRFDLDHNAWTWASDDSVMPLGAPYWTLEQSESCVFRGPPHTNPFSDPPPPLAGSFCYRSLLSPLKRSSGWCAAMTYENYHYWSDEMCTEAYSPLCVFAPKEVDGN